MGGHQKVSVRIDRDAAQGEAGEAREKLAKLKEQMGKLTACEKRMSSPTAATSATTSRAAPRCWR